MTPEQIKTMSAAKVAEALVRHNKWRRGDLMDEHGMTPSRMPYPMYDLGLIIDRAVEILKEVEDGKTDK